MHQQKGKKSLIYFFILILVGSINNMSFSNIKFDKIQNINIIGLNDIENLKVNKEIEDLKLTNIFSINTDKIKKIIDANTLVEKYTVQKNYPSTIDIKILKTNFLAKINNENKIFLVGSNGKLSSSKFSDKQLPFIFGKPEISEFLNFKKIIEKSKFEFEQVKNFYFFPSKRWDLELKNKQVLKLPQKNIRKSLDIASELLNDPKFKNVKVIDIRIQNQIIIND